MSVEVLISAILPSLCVSVIMMIFNRKQAKRDAEIKADESLQKVSNQVQLSLLLATAKLSYAVAVAMKNGAPNGEVEEGIEKYKESMDRFKEFERQLIVEKTLV